MPGLKRQSCCLIITAIAMLACSLANANGQTPDPKSKPTGSISGHVTVSGRAAEGIPVVAVSGLTVNRRDGAARAVTDGEGRFRLADLPTGQYQIWAVTPGLLAEPGPFSNYGYPFYGAIQNIILGDNESVSDIDLKLVRGAVVTGRVTDIENKPVVEERVSLQLVDEHGAPSRFGSPISTSDQMYQTDDRGIYRIYGLPAGRYKVSVGYDASDGVIRGRYQRTFYPDASDQSKGAIVELKEGSETRDIDIKIGNASRTFAVSGHVIEAETGLPIARTGVRFTLVPKDQGTSSPSFGIQADDRGEFRFDGFAPGSYRAVVTSESYGGNYFGNPVSFEVVDQNISGLELKAIPGLSVSGVVVADGVMTKDLLGMLPGLRIFARASAGSNSSAGGSSVVAPDGSFQVNGLRPGRVMIDAYASAPTYIRPSIARIEHDGIGISQEFEIKQSVSGLAVIINYGTGTIRGTVRLEGDASVANSRVYVHCKREGERDGTGSVVDARGHFMIKNLAPGTYEVTVQVGFGTPGNPYRPLPPQKQTVNVANGSESEVTFVVDVTPKRGGP